MWADVFQGIWQFDPATELRFVVPSVDGAEDRSRNILSFMNNPTLDERCAELKARMLSAHQHDKGPNPARVLVAASVGDRSKRTSSQAPKPIEAVILPPIEIRNPHPLVKAALAGMRDVGEDYGRLQFRWRGFIDVRVSKGSARRAMKIMDILIKRIEAGGLDVKITPKDPRYADQTHGLMFVSDGKERVQISVTEKTSRRDNPAWSRDKWRENRYFYTPTGHLSLILDADLYRSRTWTDKRGHRIEEYLDAVATSILLSLEDHHKARLEAEQSRLREIERQRIQAEADRQTREQASGLINSRTGRKRGRKRNNCVGSCQDGRNAPKGTRAP